MSAGGDAGAVALTMRHLRQRALSLGAANGFDYAIQFLLPVVLVRCLDPAAFGQYRLLWLAVGTIIAIAPLAMPQSLYYFLPRSNAAAKRLYVNQTLFFLGLAGLLAAWAVGPWHPWLPEKMQGLTRHEAVVPAFVLLWVMTSLLDVLPTVEERIAWQAGVTVGLSTLRALALSAAAMLTGQLEPVLVVLLAFVTVKLALLLGYVARYHGLRGPILRRDTFVDQFRHAAPFGASHALYSLRAQADQWVAAALFSLGMFASFSIAAVLWPLVVIFRHSVLHAFLPSMSRLQAAGDIRGMLDLNSRANVMVGALVYPLLAFAFVFAEEIVTIVYTAAYVDAASVMRVYVIGLAAVVVELTSIMLLLRQGAFALRVNLVVLVFAVTLSWYAAHRFGLAGAAAGSVLSIYADRIATLRRIALLSGIPLRRLQDWRGLGRLVLSAGAAAVLAWGVVIHYFTATGPLVRLAIGGALLAASYAVMAALSGMGPDGFATAENPERLRGS